MFGIYSTCSLKDIWSTHHSTCCFSHVHLESQTLKMVMIVLFARVVLFMPTCSWATCCFVRRAGPELSCGRTEKWPSACGTQSDAFHVPVGGAKQKRALRVSGGDGIRCIEVQGFLLRFHLQQLLGILRSYSLFSHLQALSLQPSALLGIDVRDRLWTKLTR